MNAQDVAKTILIALRAAGIDVSDPTHEGRAIQIISQHLPPPMAPTNQEPTNPPHG